MKILIVDDCQIIQKLTLTACRKLGFEAAVASSGEDAIEQIRGEYYDIILMDIHMSGMNGIETTVKIRELNPVETGLYIMAFTIDRGVIKTALRSGMNGTITKAPYSSQFMWEMQNLHQAITVQKSTQRVNMNAVERPFAKQRSRLSREPHLMSGRSSNTVGYLAGTTGTL
ncbi:MAG: response regulator [Verrucomicrobiota bacterium]|nr:response regulator [Verrucomicrobiota bacterium]